MIHTLRSDEDPEQTISSAEDRPDTQRERLLDGLLKQALEETRVRPQVYTDLQVLYEAVDRLQTRFANHINRHNAKDEDAADWWKRGEPPFGDDFVP